MLFALGGYNGLDLCEVECLDLHKNNYMQLPSLMNPKCASAACQLEPNLVFLFSGNTGGF